MYRISILNYNSVLEHRLEVAKVYLAISILINFVEYISDLTHLKV